MQGKRIATRETARHVHDILKNIWTSPVPLLTYANPFELLCAVILSAQCTDAMVNRITPRLFELWPDPLELSRADTASVEIVIKPAGFYRVKAAHLVQTARILHESHGGMVPDDMDSLTALPGVGRKTANVVRSAIYGHPAIIVDTHFIRVSNRLGLAKSSDPAAIEIAVGKMIPREDWTAFSHELNRHGRAVCPARKPLCDGCPVAGFCPSAGSHGTAGAHKKNPSARKGHDGKDKPVNPGK